MGAFLLGILALLKNPVALFTAFNNFVTIVHEIKNLFKKDPIEEIRKGEQKQAEGEKKASDGDDTSEILG